MSENKPLITLKDVSYQAGKNHILENINLEVMSGDFWGVVGPNGAGKSTLLKIILGLLQPTGGSVEIGANVQFGYVPQFSSFNNNFPVTVEKMLLLGSLQYLRDRSHDSEVYEKCGQLLQDIGLYGLRSQPVKDLSGGEIQRLLVARALINNANCIVLDEPTASLDTEYRNIIFDKLHELNKSVTLILVSHDLEAVSSYVKQIGCLNKHLYCHSEPKNINKSLEKVFGCPVDLIAHGFPHRVLEKH
ncbi:metal ABC transporter ATP-binding protein [Clostridia bacterium]|nr:metal ABC transporter ATP-binding protein [Clostridia bacterium]